MTIAEATVGANIKLIRAVAALDDVLYVERRLVHSTFNKYASWLTQSGVENKHTIWDKGKKINDLQNKKCLGMY